MIGQGNNEGMYSYLAFGRQTALSAFITAPSAVLEFMSAGLKGNQGKKTIEQVERRRVHAKRVPMGKVIEGEVEGYFFPDNTACAWIMQNAFGGAITSATTTGESAGGDAFTHTQKIGNVLEQTYSALTILARKGDSLTGKTFRYDGMRVGEWGLSAELDDALKFTTSFMGRDFTGGATDNVANLTTAAWECLNFIDGRISVEGTAASLTSSSYWHVQSMNFAVGNSLKSGNESRRIGSDLLDVLPPGMASPSLNVTMRFDTTTAIDAMRDNSTLAAEFEFQGPTMTGSNQRIGLKIDMPKIAIEDAGDPEIGGPDEQLVSEVSFTIYHDDSSAGGYSVKSELTNLIANYN
ncbi:MAG: hypothetical protein HKM92_08585 [Arenibacter sp.]|nr:hypothetical protein [Arenibacter sp.]